jgi:oligoendopeptidase F
MRTVTLPSTPEAFRDGRWEDILPYYEELAVRPLDDVEDWLRDWSRLESLLGEAHTLASIRYTSDTTDPEWEDRYLRFSADVGPKAGEQSVRLGRRLVESGHSRAGLETAVRRFRNSIDLFREENVPLQGELSKLNARHQKLTGAMTVEWDGQEMTPMQLRPYIAAADRSVRERAWRLHYQPYIDQRDEMAAIFDAQYELRQRSARNAGFANYRDYAHRQRNRFDYTSDDCLRWHEAVELTAVPAAKRILDRHRREFGLDVLRPWDVEYNPDSLGRPPLKPFAETSVLADRAGRMFERVDPELGRHFQTMMEEELLDLDSRKGKAPGGYCTSLPFRERPFIFMNSAGVDGDVKTLLHEAGHAFHSFETMAAQPLVWQRTYGSEMAEVASMSMELLAGRYLEESAGGLYSPEEARRSRIQHLEGIVLFFGHCASVDAFQHWIYTDPLGADRDARDRKWLELRSRFQRGVDWSGLDAQRVARWYAQLHIFLHPFYYIEYGIAQLGALQVWRNALRDQRAAVSAYRGALALGGSRPLPELYEAAGARLVFDAAGMSELIDLCESELDRLIKD